MALTASIILQNTSTYAARTPAVIVELHGITIAPERWSDGPGWTATVRDRISGEISTLQWDGGPSYAIHGNSIRHLPDLNLQGLGRNQVGAKMIIRLLADGYNRSEIALPVKIGSGDPKKFRIKSPEWL
jgi:hypothetical protein